MSALNKGPGLANLILDLLVVPSDPRMDCEENHGSIQSRISMGFDEPEDFAVRTTTCRNAGCEEKSRRLTEYEIARMKTWLDVAIRAITAMHNILGEEDEVYPIVLPTKRSRQESIGGREAKRQCIEGVTSATPSALLDQDDGFSGDTDIESDGNNSDIQEIPLINLVTPQSTQARI